MNFSATPLHKTKIGTCPHGLPQGACPICSGMGGGGGIKKNERPAGEMTWDECFAIGQMLKTQKLASQKRDLAMQAQFNPPVKNISYLENIAQKIADLTQKLSEFVQNSQTTTLKPFVKLLILAVKVAIPVLNILKSISLIAQKTINFIQEKAADISDKLNAILGELKNSIEKQISDKLTDFKKKIKSLFSVFETSETKDEDSKIDEAKAILKLKTIFHNVKEKLFNEGNYEYDKH
jgi:hypothetical protein